MTAAFGADQPVDGSGVLVLAGGRYLACTMRDACASGDSGLAARDVMSGVESSITAEDFADYLSRYRCFRVTRQ